MGSLFEEVAKSILDRRKVAFRKSCDMSAKYVERNYDVENNIFIADFPS